MRRVKILVFSIVTVSMVALFHTLVTYEKTSAQTAQEVKMPDVIMLGPEAKLGRVTFNHRKHNGGTYSIDGTGPIGCVECHHVARPASELVKLPPLKTAWPADRTTTLTEELFNKDPAGVQVAACRSCHVRTGETPKLVPQIPEIKHESSTALIQLTNQQAFHRNCAGCHTEAKKQKPLMKGPTALQCTMCHKKS